MSLQIKENIALAPLTTLKLGGPARYFAEITSIKELVEAADFAKKNSLQLFVLAGGSNLVISSKGLNGLVLEMGITGLTINGNHLTAGAATPMKELVDRSISARLAGLEWAGGLPGSFGGAIRGNAGCFGAETKDIITNVTTFSLVSQKTCSWNNAECQFGYRDSFFKHQPEEVIIEATVALKPGNQTELRAIADDHIRYRQQKHPMEYPNAGSMFKNTPVEIIPQQWREFFKASIKTDPFPVVPTARIIAETGLAGLQVGNAQLSTKHTNYVVNVGNATGEDVQQLVEQIERKVFEKFGIRLETEPAFVGF